MNLSTRTLPSLPAVWPGIFRWQIINEHDSSGSVYQYITIQRYDEKRSFWTGKMKGRWVILAKEMVISEMSLSRGITEVFDKVRLLHSESDNTVMATRSY